MFNRNLNMIGRCTIKNIRSNTTNAAAPAAPETAKVSSVAKMKVYFKNLFKDYGEMLLEVQKDIQDRPQRALAISGALIATYALFTNTPDEKSFIEDVRRYSNELIQVNAACQKSECVQHLQHLEDCINAGTLRYIKAGVFSVVYVDDYDESVALYQANCSYLRPTYFELTKRVIDIGFMGKWWKLFNIMIDYDVNKNNFSQISYS